MIEKMNLKTPGREEDDSDQAVDLKANAAAVKKEMKEKQAGNTKDSGEDRLEMGRTIVNALGGKANIVSLENCFSRLRVEVNDMSLIDDKTLKGTGAAGIMKKGSSVQVVYGLSVSKVRSIVDEVLETM